MPPLTAPSLPTQPRSPASVLSKSSPVLTPHPRPPTSAQPSCTLRKYPGQSSWLPWILSPGAELQIQATQTRRSLWFPHRVARPHQNFGEIADGEGAHQGGKASPRWTGAGAFRAKRRAEECGFSWHQQGRSRGLVRWGGEGIPKCLACILRSKHMAQKACVCVCTHAHARVCVH